MDGLHSVIWSAVVYCVARAGFVWPGAPDGWVVVCGPVAVGATAAIGYTWVRFSRRVRKLEDPTAVRLEKVLLGLGVVCSVAAWIPGVVFRNDVVEQTIPWMELTYRLPALGVAPFVAFAPTLFSVALVAHLRVRTKPRFGLGALLVVVVLSNEVLAAARLLPTPRLGELLVVALVAGTLSRVADAARDRVQHRLSMRDEMLEIAQRRLSEQRRLAELGQLAAAVGHEINNPLTYVIANIEHVLHEATLATEEAEALTEALNGAERIAHIVADLRLLSRRPALKEVAAVDVAEAVERSIRGLPAVSRGRVRSLVRGDARVRATPERLEQVFANLVHNALDSSPDAHVTLSAERVDEHVHVVVEDDGPGMTQQTLARVFEPFFTTKGHRGTGLGLPIVATLVEQMGGTIDLRSEEGRGTRVELVLPIADVGRDAPRRANTDSVPSRSTHVLLVEDEPKVASAILRMLHDHEVTWASSVAAARLELSRRRFDLVVSDVGLPDGSGVDLVADVGDQPILFITGGVVDERTRAALLASDRPWLEKPFTASELRKMVHRSLP